MLRAALTAALLVAPPSLPQTPVPRLLIEAADGSLSETTADSLPADGRADLGGLVLRVADTSVPDPPPIRERAEVVLVGGDRLRGAIAGGEDESLLFELATGILVPLPIDAIESLIFSGRLPRDPGVAVEAPSEGDRLYRLVGNRLDRVDGAVAGFSAEGVRFDGVVGASRFSWEEVAALFVEPLGDLDEGPTLTSPVAVDLADGSRLRGDLERIDRDGVELRVQPAGVPIFLRWRAVAEVSVADGRLRYLSELAPDVAVDASPFGDDLGMVWPHNIDRAVTGGPLLAGGVLWTRGIGVHAPSRLEYVLDGDYRELRGSVSLDDSVLELSARGSVKFRIEADGELLWESAIQRGGDPVRRLPTLSLEGVSRLALIVDEADERHVADRADWLRLRLVR
ncbi:NPCBM/NEW2 domain-containing protein [Engelhardtia mirabilis]|uniref:NPCBM/NEW2 domain protein n=1 Tax=Engelhardtia mirabilis TaxID=2528011 RepID=A0A518BMA8_9BACT|nr:NPCBM/NEW2 domain protein [Planctomycetes bacterium Pla133]QDV02402.1 NPCBM/NEW2 domain protein [Planctomycetes bacterium Pla86]